MNSLKTIKYLNVLTICLSATGIAVIGIFVTLILDAGSDVWIELEQDMSDFKDDSLHVWQDILALSNEKSRRVKRRAIDPLLDILAGISLSPPSDSNDQLDSLSAPFPTLPPTFSTRPPSSTASKETTVVTTTPAEPYDDAVEERDENSETLPKRDTRSEKLPKSSERSVEGSNRFTIPKSPVKLRETLPVLRTPEKDEKFQNLVRKLVDDALIARSGEDLLRAHLDRVLPPNSTINSVRKLFPIVKNEPTCHCNAETKSCPAGPRGQPGPRGSTGEDGAPGTPGLRGKDGENVYPTFYREVRYVQKGRCRICPRGPPGPKGRTGMPGLQGPKGLKGRVGARGRPGNRPGRRGSIGNFGSSGSPGRAGGQGPPGEMVLIRRYPSGPKGEPGHQGLPGWPGYRGRPGFDTPGDPGSPGPRGLSGSNGVPGLEGIQGKTGRRGRGTTKKLCYICPKLHNSIPKGDLSNGPPSIEERSKPKILTKLYGPTGNPSIKTETRSPTLVSTEFPTDFEYLRTTAQPAHPKKTVPTNNRYEKPSIPVPTSYIQPPPAILSPRVRPPLKVPPESPSIRQTERPPIRIPSGYEPPRLPYRQRAEIPRWPRIPDPSDGTGGYGLPPKIQEREPAPRISEDPRNSDLVPNSGYQTPPGPYIWRNTENQDLPRSSYSVGGDLNAPPESPSIRQTERPPIAIPSGYEPPRVPYRKRAEIPRWRGGGGIPDTSDRTGGYGLPPEIRQLQPAPRTLEDPWDSDLVPNSGYQALPPPYISRNTETQDLPRSSYSVGDAHVPESIDRDASDYSNSKPSSGSYNGKDFSESSYGGYPGSASPGNSGSFYGSNSGDSETVPDLGEWGNPADDYEDSLPSGYGSYRWRGKRPDTLNPSYNPQDSVQISSGSRATYPSDPSGGYETKPEVVFSGYQTPPPQKRRRKPAETLEPSGYEPGPAAPPRQSYGSPPATVPPPSYAWQTGESVPGGSDGYGNSYETSDNYGSSYGEGGFETNAGYGTQGGGSQKDGSSTDDAWSGSETERTGYGADRGEIGSDSGYAVPSISSDWNGNEGGDDARYLPDEEASLPSAPYSSYNSRPNDASRVSTSSTQSGYSAPSGRDSRIAEARPAASSTYYPSELPGQPPTLGKVDQAYPRNPADAEQEQPADSFGTPTFPNDYAPPPPVPIDPETSPGYENTRGEISAEETENSSTRFREKLGAVWPTRNAKEEFVSIPSSFVGREFGGSDDEFIPLGRVGETVSLVPRVSETRLKRQNGSTSIFSTPHSGKNSIHRISKEGPPQPPAGAARIPAFTEKRPELLDEDWLTSDTSGADNRAEWPTNSDVFNSAKIARVSTVFVPPAKRPRKTSIFRNRRISARRLRERIKDHISDEFRPVEDIGFRQHRST